MVFSRLTSSKLRLLAAGLATLVSCDGTQGPEYTLPARGELRGTNLILITVDTARRDHFSCYGVPGLEGTTPAIDALAGEGALFLDAYSQTNVTNPSHVAIFTGMYALDSRVMNNTTRFEKAAGDVDTLPAAFRRAGYRTAGFAAITHVSPEGLALPGFQETNAPSRELRAKASMDNLLEWVGTGSPRPFFAWLHLFDPHSLYDPPPRFEKKFYQGDPERGSGRPLGNVEEFRESVHEQIAAQFAKVRDRAYPRALYRAEVNFVDDQVGRLVRRLKQSGLYDDTAIVLIGDHGESLGEHGIYYGHRGIYDATVRIPFIARLPGFPAGIRVSPPVSQIDVAPTLDFLFDLGMSGPRPLRGVNLADALAGSPDPLVAEREWLILESVHNQQVGVRRGRWKAIYTIWDWDYEVQLFDLEEDPQEENDVADRHPERVEEMRKLVEPWLDAGMWTFESPDVQKGLAAQLRALGYLREDDPQTTSRPRSASSSTPETPRASER